MEDNDKARPVLSRMSTHAKEVVESMSDIVWSLNSKNDSFVHLVDRLQSFATHLLEPRGCVMDFRRPDNLQEIRLNMEQRRNLYLILKEAINNSAKYAEASRFWVYFNLIGNELSIEIGDNGKGFDSSKESTGNGLESMQNRARNMGAKCSIVSEEGKGVRITISLKIRKN
jgi:signal transduction histidine kinase